MYRDGSCFLTHLSPDGNYYFQLMKKLDKTYSYPDIPRYSDEDTQEYVRSMADLRSRDINGVSLGDLWKKIVRYKLVAMEEGYLKRWTWGRIALMGDAVHKVNIVSELRLAILTNLCTTQRLHQTQVPAPMQLSKALQHWLMPSITCLSPATPLVLLQKPSKLLFPATTIHGLHEQSI